MNRYREQIHECMEELVAFRRELHRHPEPSLKEFETTDRICRELDRAGIAYRRMEPTGVVGELKGTKAASDHMVLLRSDMDALEILEQTGLDFPSENPGVMHACGHDTHMTNLLGAVKFLHAHPEEFAGTVRFVFQPAEEIGAGARLMIQQGVMEGVDRAVGMHITPILPLGQVSAMPGECWAACDRIKITVHGKAAHGAMPQNGHDALVAASAIVMALQPLVSRETDPNTALVLTVGSIVSGSRFNIVAGDAVMMGRCRTFSREVHAALPEKLRRVAEPAREAPPRRGACGRGLRLHRRARVRGAGRGPVLRPRDDRARPQERRQGRRRGKRRRLRPADDRRGFLLLHRARQVRLLQPRRPRRGRQQGLPAAFRPCAL